MNEYKPKSYKISEFEERDIVNLKAYLKKAILGFIEVTIDDKVNRFIEELKNVSFRYDDSFELGFTISTIGNDILTALGISINERKIKPSKMTKEKEEIVEFLLKHRLIEWAEYIESTID